MQRISVLSRCALFLLCAGPLAAVELSPGFLADDVPRYGLFEFVVSNTNDYSNPFDYQEIELTATFTAPDDRTQTVFGFYDGDGAGSQDGDIWRLRFMPDQPGEWTYTYSWQGSSSAKPGGGSGAFTCVASSLRGPLAIDMPKGWYLEDARGEPFHWRPYDLHAIGANSSVDQSDYPVEDVYWSTDEPTDWCISLMDSHALPRGYNSVMLPSCTATWDGMPRTWWWQNDRSTNVFDVAVFRQYDRLLKACYDRGLYAHTFFHLGGEKRSATRQLGRYLGARQWAYYVMFGYCPSWETSSDAGYEDAMAMIRDSIPYPAILASQSSAPSSKTPWIKMYNRQRHKGDPALGQHNLREWSKPDGFESGNEDIWEGFHGNGRRMRQVAWAEMLAGVVPVYSELAWKISQDKFGNGDGGPFIIAMFDWWYSHVNYRHADWHMRNAKTGGELDNIRTSGIPDEEYVTYTINGGDITIDLADDTGVFNVSWFDPINDETYDNHATVTAGTSRTLSPPFTGEAVLFLHKSGGPDDETPPTAPTGVQATPLSDSAVSLSWNAASDPETGVAGYRIYRDSSLAGTSDTVSFTDSGLDPATTYTYTVSAFNGAGDEGDASGPVDATTAAYNPPPSIAITVPAADAVVATGSALTIGGTSDDDGSVERVVVVGTDATGTEIFRLTDDSPAGGWSVTWNAPVIGDHAVIATATDDLGKTTSASVSFYVRDPLGLMLEADPQQGAAPLTVAFTATASGGASGGTVPELLWWRFEEGSGDTALDASAAGHDGAVTATWDSGYHGLGLIFDGTGDQVVDADGEDYLNGLDAITVTMWVQADGTGTDRGVLTCSDPDGRDEGLSLRYDSSGASGGGDDVIKAALTTTGGTVTLESAADVQTTDWQHLALTWSSGTGLTLYIDGVASTPTANEGPVSGTISELTTLIVGRGPKDASGGWSGMIDDVRIYDHALDGDDIAAVMNGGGGTTYAWDFDADGVVDDTTRVPSHTFAENGMHVVSCTVTDLLGSSVTETITVIVGVRSIIMDLIPDWAWECDPAAASESQDAETHTFDGLPATVDHVVRVAPSSDG